MIHQHTVTDVTAITDSYLKVRSRSSCVRSLSWDALPTRLPLQSPEFPIGIKVGCWRARTSSVGICLTRTQYFPTVAPKFTTAASSNVHFSKPHQTAEGHTSLAFCGA